MLGNLFNSKRTTTQDSALAKQQAMQYQQTTTVTQQSHVVGSKMNPAVRQELSALSHLDSRTTSSLHHAQEETRRIQQEFIEPEQILYGLLYDEDIYKLLEQFSVDAASVSREIQNNEKQGTFTGNPTLSETSKHIYEQAYSNAKNRGVNFVTPEDVLLVLFDEKLPTATYLTVHGIKKEQLEERLVKSPNYALTKRSLAERYGVDLTEQARKGLLDPVAGRDKEIDRLIHILLRRTKNNPIIIGEAGVGKTAIVEGLAENIVAGRVPKELSGRRILQLDIASLVAGASHRGEFEERLKGVIQEAQASNGNIILFIDEIHTVIGTGEQEGALDASNIIKPYLARGQLQIIGTTTTAEYRKHFEKDKAFQRRFQPIVAEEPSEETAVAMLKVLRPKYEKFHKVTITDEAIDASVKLSKKYIGERYLPDKAIDLMDEAAAEVKLRYQPGYQPPKEETPLQVPSGQAGTMRDAQQASVSAQPGGSDSQPAQPNPQGDPNSSQPQQEVPGQPTQDGQQPAQSPSQVQDPSQQQQAISVSQQPTDQKGADGKIPDKTHADIASVGEVRKEDIEKVVSSWTGIPITKLTEDESEKLLKLDQRIHQRLIDQEEAVIAVAEAVRRGRIGLANANRPIASFIFLGPTGVGKTELAKTLAEILFGREDAMVRLDMSEYMEKHEVAKLIGAPPGYVGYEEGGQLTEAVRIKPYSIVLLDEIEKAHPDVFNILLQVLEDGRLTDNKGNTISFKNTIIIATSNIGSSLIQQQLSVDKAPKTQEQYAMQFTELTGMLVDELHRFFKPELLNRFDEVVIFKPLQPQHMLQIARLGIEKTAKLLKEQEFTLDISDKALSVLAQEGYDPVYGARPLRRLIQTAIENPIAVLIIGKTFVPQDTIYIDYDDTRGDFSFHKKGASVSEGVLTTNTSTAAFGASSNGDSTTDQKSADQTNTDQQPTSGQQTPPFDQNAMPQSPVQQPTSPPEPAFSIGQVVPELNQNPMNPANPQNPLTTNPDGTQMQPQ